MQGVRQCQDDQGDVEKDREDKVGDCDPEEDAHPGKIGICIDDENSSVCFRTEFTYLR